MINRCRRTILGRAITPTTAAFQHMHDTADDAAIIGSLDPAHIRRQVKFDPLPLLIAKPKKVPGHDPNPLPKTNQDRIVRAKKLMSSDPSAATRAVFYDELLAESPREPWSDEPRKNVGRAARGRGGDDADRPRRIGLRPSEARYSRERGSARCEMEKISAGKFHDCIQFRSETSLCLAPAFPEEASTDR